MIKNDDDWAEELRRRGEKVSERITARKDSSAQRNKS
jgi:hypothetical protein